MKKIAVDFGSGFTKIYIPGCGVVLREATCIAVEQFVSDGENTFAIKACGDKARALSGRAAVNTRIINPVVEGDIVNEILAARLFAYFLEKIEITYKKARRTEVMFVLPCGLSGEVRGKYRKIAEECGIGSVYFTLTPYAAVIGGNAIISESTPTFSLDIGHSLTGIAAFSQDGIVSGLSVNLGGANIDAHIIDELAENHNLKIGGLTAERLKNTVGSLLEDDNRTTVVDGRAVSDGAQTSLFVGSGQIYEVITTYVDKILEYVALVISKLPEEAASAVVRGGIYLSGGLAKMDGLADYIREKLNIPVTEFEEPQLAAVIGGGAILSDYALTEKFAIGED